MEMKKYPPINLFIWLAKIDQADSENYKWSKYFLNKGSFLET